jgi:hypothetical protein
MAMARITSSLLVLAYAASLTFAADVEPIRLHPRNGHYFLFREKPAVLITSGEHYGAVMNLDFDYVRYLEVLKSHGFNLTRTFSGAYREVPGSFNITGNTLAPARGKFVCPWARSSTAGASDGDNKFDLTKWDSAYFERLKDFVREAGKREIVVELVLFCTMYDEKVWEASPMNVRNNINGVGGVERHEVYGGRNQKLLAVQEAMTAKLVAELNEFDNVYFEICNEPYERGGLTPEWNDRIVAAIQKAEASLPNKHLTAQGFPPSDKAIANLNPAVSVLNFHAARPESVLLNYSLDRVIAFDETGGSDTSDRKYRTEGWDFVVAGGGVFDHLDFSFTPDHEDGMAVPLPAGTPGGGGPELRKQLAVLKQFIDGFDFVRMTPSDSVIQKSEIQSADSGEGSNRRPTARVLAEAGRAYAVYINGGTQAELTLDLPGATYTAEWVNTKNGIVEKRENFQHEAGDKTLSSPAYQEDLALRLQRSE